MYLYKGEQQQVCNNFGCRGIFHLSDLKIVYNWYYKKSCVHTLKCHGGKYLCAWTRVLRAAVHNSMLYTKPLLLTPTTPQNHYLYPPYRRETRKTTYSCLTYVLCLWFWYVQGLRTEEQPFLDKFNQNRKVNVNVVIR